MAKYAVNPEGVAKAKALIGSHHYVLKSTWGDVQPDTDAQNAFIERHGIEEYGAWHLATKIDTSPDTKGHYGFVFGDFRRVHRMALIACQFRAAEWNHKDIELAAHELLQLLDSSRS
jgi:hypothetical protein